MRRSLSWIATLLAACGGTGDTPPDASVGIDTSTADAPRQVQTFHCAKNATCPAVTIAGDPDSSDAFHGLGDPSLERDGDGTLWLTYSWLDHEPLDTATIHAVRTHLAKSTDNGATWTFVRALNAALPAPNNVALVIHEVSSIARRPDNTWHATWLTYGQPAAGAGVQFHYQRTIASAPAQLGDAGDAWLRGTFSQVTTQHTGMQIAGVENCFVFTEPALFTHAGTSYLATTCIVDPAQPALQRLVLLRESGTDLVYVGDLLSSADAAELGGTRVEQIDLSVAKDGSVIAIVTPIADGMQPPHRGCIVLEVEDIATAKMRRAGGKLVRRAVITADGNSIGPGLCTYDKDSTTGVLLDIVTQDGANVEFSLRATGIHP